MLLGLGTEYFLIDKSLAFFPPRKYYYVLGPAEHWWAILQQIGQQLMILFFGVIHRVLNFMKDLENGNVTKLGNSL